MIKNNRYGEYLYAHDNEQRGEVYTWGHQDRVTGLEWKITPVDGATRFIIYSPITNQHMFISDHDSLVGRRGARPYLINNLDTDLPDEKSKWIIECDWRNQTQEMLEMMKFTYADKE